MIGFVLSMLLSLAGQPSPGDVGGEELGVGHWVVVRGEFVEERFVAARLEVIEAERYELLIGTVEREDGAQERFTILGQRVNYSDRTEWNEGVRPGSLAGRRIKLEGRWRGPEKFSAREISARGPGRDRISGRVDLVERVEGGRMLSLLSLAVFVPDALELEHDQPLADYARIPPRAEFDPHARADVDSQDLDDLFGDGIVLFDGLRLDGQLEGRSTSEDNFNLDDADPEDRLDLTGSLRLRLSWWLSDQVDLVSELRYGWRSRDDEDDGRSKTRDADLGEAFLRLTRPFGLQPLEIVVGRQDFDDAREWIYDQNLDAVRLRWRDEAFDVELSHSTVLADGSDRDEATNNWIAHVSNGDRKRHLAGWAVHRDSDLRTSAEEEGLHLGGRMLGEWLPNSEIWIEAAHLRGRRAGTPVRAWGYDVGGTWLPFGEDWLSLTGGYAYGSGDQTVGQRDGNFRQTGLQDNNGRFAGITSFRYYGELVDPELSNLGITTLGIGVRPWKDTSIDAVWHEYLQDKAVPALADSGLGLRPDGLSADIGRELDLIVGWRGLDGWDLELVGALFEPGDAFPGADTARLLKFQLRYRF